MRPISARDGRRPEDVRSSMTLPWLTVLKSSTRNKQNREGRLRPPLFFDDRQTTCIFFEKMHVKAARRVVAPYRGGGKRTVEGESIHRLRRSLPRGCCICYRQRSPSSLSKGGIFRKTDRILIRSEKEASASGDASGACVGRSEGCRTALQKNRSKPVSIGRGATG